MGRFKRKSKKGKIHDVKQEVKEYIATNKPPKKPKIKDCLWFNAQLLGLVREFFLILKKNKKYGDFINTYCKIEKDVIEGDKHMEGIVHQYYRGGGNSIVQIGKYFRLYITQKMVNSPFSSILGRLTILNLMIMLKGYPSKYISREEILEMYLEDSYEKQGLTKSKIPNEMVFSMRIGMILAAIFYIIIACFVALIMSPMAAFVYSAFTFIVIFAFIVKIN